MPRDCFYTVLKFVFSFLLLITLINLKAQPIRDNKRLVYLFGDTQPMIQQQLDTFSQASAGCEERDIKVILADTAGNQKETLYSKYKVTRNQFMVILVGKDGGEKFRSTKPVSTDQLFAIIDQMPMRQQEIKLKPDK